MTKHMTALLKRPYFLIVGLLAILAGCPRPPRFDVRTLPQGEGNTTVATFSRAKKLLYSQIHNDPESRITFYCDSPFDAKKQLDHSVSGYVSERRNPQAKVVSAEHVRLASTEIF